MLQEHTVEVGGALTWGNAGDWRAVDGALRAIARRRAGLDADEARWLREAEAMQIWRPLGMVNALDYMERVLGYSPRVGQERLRVARALGELPMMENALATGELSYSAVRELSRVATRATEDAWVRAAAGMNLREIEELVVRHAPGALPDEPADPTVRPHVVRFELSPETYARLRQARAALDEEHGGSLSDDELVAALCDAALDAPAERDDSGRARYQIATSVCPTCRAGSLHGAGVAVPVSAAAIERAECDAQRIGSLDGDAPERAMQDIPPATVRFVLRRDGGRCRVPGCRSARGLEIHRIRHRAHGGTHEPANLVVLCSACHQAHHDGRLAIRGTADKLDVTRPGAPPPPAHVGANPYRADALLALTRMGWSAAIARCAVDEAIAALEPDAPLERLVFEALRRCPH
jgi:hypothetical protein